MLGSGAESPNGHGAPRPGRVIGLTGGIASGKSTVARFLRDLGIPVVDADQVARDVVAPGSPGLASIVHEFGEGVLDDAGGLDRQALGAVVFAEPERRKVLEGITHPAIGVRSARLLQDHLSAGHDLVVYEAPLLVETGRHEQMAALVVVSVPEEVQLERVMARDGLDEGEARARIAAQLPLADKVAVADIVIDNSGNLEALEVATARAVETLRGNP